MKKSACIVLAFWCAGAIATPGGLDSNGCHKSKADGYHCHGVKLEKIRPYIAGETQFEHSKRLAAQCLTQKNEGVCFGYAPK